ncbi:8381d201-8d09-46f8-90a6-3cc1c6cbfc1d [Sclerotinia trifoliorum]|uniref:8381d201-8d09-46f8-90a6-3cc1c6cbfc1d n=1 Tax=Sclerotinia trifoliorum TaxID=28548 RepID=A0A8H2ZKU9_9HELO|nr:8381d201-8d09-46f8-90a6-3cc1c6cbfc1d [Sclerotinia trifoliorum]
MTSSKFPNLGTALGDEVVTVTVGKEKRKFVLHKQLLCDSVQYFRSAFSAGAFKEGQESIMDIPEDEPEAFELFVNWLYRASLPTSSRSGDLHWLLSLYIFAEKLCMNELANKTIDAIQAMTSHPEIYLPLNMEVTKKIWRNTSPTSPLRTFCIHALVFELCNFEQLHEGLGRQSFMDNYDLIASWSYFKDNCDLYASFFIQLQKHSINDLPCDPSDLSLWTKCYFHRHSKGEICHN